MGGFLGGLIKGVGNAATGGLLDVAGSAMKLFSKNKPQQIQSQLTPQQKAMLANRYRQLQAKAADTQGLDYVKKAGSIYDQSMGM